MSFEPSILAELAPAFDDQFVHVARLVPRLVTDIFGVDAVSIHLVAPRPLQSRRRHDAAVLCVVKTADGERLRLYHLEFQSRPDRVMAIRILEYQLALAREHDAPIASMVAYLVAPSDIDERAGRGRLEVQDGEPVRWRWSVRCISEEPVSLFEDPDRPSLAILSSAAVGGCTALALRRSLTTILQHWGSTPSLNRLLALHFAFAELRCCGLLWKEVAASLGVKMNDVVEEDGFARMVRRRWELAERDGRLVGLAEGREQGREQGLAEGLQQGLEQGLDQGRQAALRAARDVLAPAEFERLVRALGGAQGE